MMWHECSRPSREDIGIKLSHEAENKGMNETAAADIHSSQSELGQYTWMLFGDLTGGNTGVRVWQSGPEDGARRASYQELVKAGKPFELSNKDGDVLYTGYIVGSFCGEEPLADYGAQHGCCQITYTD